MLLPSGKLGTPFLPIVDGINMVDPLAQTVSHKVGGLSYGNLDELSNQSEEILSPEQLSALFRLKYPGTDIIIQKLFHNFLMKNKDELSKVCGERFMGYYIDDFADCMLSITTDGSYTRRLLFCLNSFILSLKEQLRVSMETLDSHELKSILGSIRS